MHEPEEFEKDSGSSPDSDSPSSDSEKHEAEGAPSPESGSASSEERQAEAAPSSDLDSTASGKREAEAFLSPDSDPASREEHEAEVVPWFLSRRPSPESRKAEVVPPSEPDSAPSEEPEAAPSSDAAPASREGYEAPAAPWYGSSFIFLGALLSGSASAPRDEHEAEAVPSSVPTFDLAPSAPRFAARAHGCSWLVHAAVLMVLMLVPWQMFNPLPRVVPQAAREERALLLAPLGSGGGGSASGGAGQPGAGKAGAPRPGPGKRAGQVVFRGPQPIVSNPPHPDNFLQTIRQPDLLHPPRLKRPIPSPNIVLIAPHPQPPPPKSAKRAAIKAVRIGAPIPITPQPVELQALPKLVLPPSGEMAVNILRALPQNQAALPKPPVPPPPPVVSQEGSDLRNLLVLNAVAQAVPPPSIAPGELSGSFTVSPSPTAEVNPTATTEQAGAGGATGGTGAQGSGAGGPSSGSGTGTGGKGSGTGGGGGGGGGGNGSGSGVGTGTGPGAGGGPGGTGHGPGGGQGSGSGSGSGSGPGSGSGAGMSLGGPGGAGGGPFKDVAVGEAPRLEPPSSRPKLGHQSFDLTIVSTSSSGGGLRDYGVFKDQVVYTVYIDVDEPGHHRPRWTLQYALMGRGDSVPNNASLLPPYPIKKEFPRRLPMRPRDVGRMIVATGVVDKQGKLTGLKVIQSPNSLLIEPLLDLLAKWTLQAAEVNREPVEVRILLGIPISADWAENYDAATAK